MKHFGITFLMILFICAGGFAKRISEQDAYSIAEKFLEGRSIKADPRFAMESKGSPASKSYYIFNVENNGGFVIVSGDDLTPAVLGYSDKGNIDLSNMPSNLQWLLDSYDTQISTLAEESPIVQMTRTEDREEIPTMINVQWGQGEPFNNNCPTYEGERCLTGCVATAMAQLIQYHQWPQDEILSIPAYTTSTHGIYVDELPPSSFDWDKMDDISIPRLMRYCGQAIQMDYSPIASGGSLDNVVMALKDFFNYSFMASLEGRYTYTDSEWDSLIYNELKEGRPILYAGESSDTGAHAFIVDGFAANLYHLNWGWEGLGDGYFTLDTLNPLSENGYIKGQTAIINAYPSDPEKDKKTPRLKVTGLDCSERTLIRNSSSEDFPWCSIGSSYENSTGNKLIVEIGYALYKDGNIIDLLSTLSTEIAPYAGNGASADVHFTTDIPVGDYKVIMVYRLDASDSWLPLRDSDRVFLEVKVTDKELLIQPYPIPTFENDIIDFGTQVVDGIRYRLRAEYGSYLAYPQPLDGEHSYQGELYIPDFIVHDEIKYNVSNKSGFANGLLDENTQVSALSTPIAFDIRTATGLKSVEFREGVTALPTIFGCPLLESIIAKTPTKVPKYYDCDNLKSLIFHNNHNIKLSTSSECVIWSKDDLPSLTDVYFTADVPPAFFWEYADYVEVQAIPCDNVTIHVPSEMKDVYEKHGWYGWHIVDDQPPLPSRVIWNYGGNDVSSGQGIGYYDPRYDIEFAIRIPAKYLDAYKSCKITSIEYVAYDASHVGYVFLTTPGQDYYTKQAANTIEGSKTRITLETPYVITGEDIFVGIGQHSETSVSWANDDIEENGLWLRVMGEDKHDEYLGAWERVVAEDNYTHPVPISIIIEGDNLPDDVLLIEATLVQSDENGDSSSLKSSEIPNVRHDLLPHNDHGFIHFNTKGDLIQQEKDKYKTQRQITGSNKESDKDRIRLKMRNRSPRIVRDVTLDWMLDGKEMAPISLNTVFPQNFNEFVYIDLPEEMQGRNHYVEFTVSEIEGQPDTVTYNNTNVFNFSSRSSLYFPRKFVMEEATGTWCGYCPTGLATIEKMKENYPDNFIAIGVHSDAEMSLSDDSYKSFLDMVDAFPSARLNRTKWVDLFPFTLDSDKEMAEAMIKATASFAEGNRVEVRTETTFGFDDFGEDRYRIAYVITEDNVGPHFQNNNYSDPNPVDDPDDYMNWWSHQQQMVPYVYDDVARSIHFYEGVGGLFPENIEEGKEYSNCYKVELPGNIDNHDNLFVVTLLLDSVSGEILNADRSEIDGIYDSVAENYSVENVRIRIIDGILIIENAMGKNVSVSHIDGISVLQFNASSDFERLYLQNGIYLVKIGNQAAKIIIK